VREAFDFSFAVVFAVAVAFIAFESPLCRSGGISGKKLPGEVFNDACVGPEGVASKDGGHKNP